MRKPEMKIIFLAMCVGLVISCTPPVTSIPDPAKPYLHISHQQNDSTISVISEVSPITVSLHDWIERIFVVLEKQKLFCGNGYELYTCRELQECTHEADTAWELLNHRVRCDKIARHRLRVTDVEQLDKEWRVTFADEESGNTVYAKTHKGALKEVAFEADLESARNRWLHKTIFSRRGVIATFSGGGNFGSYKVKIQDSLQVTDVTWGITPLPVHPIWLHVETRKGQRGFIPVRYSWTNIMEDQIRDTVAWADDILETDPGELYTWNETTWELINNHRIVIEMERDQVRLSWGEPLKREYREFEGFNRECWIYSSQELYFDDHGLIAIK